MELVQYGMAVHQQAGDVAGAAGVLGEIGALVVAAGLIDQRGGYLGLVRFGCPAGLWRSAGFAE